MKKTKDNDGGANFRRVALSQLKQGRRGKHHDLVEKVLRELKSLGTEEALQVPLSTLKGLSAPNFRSVINRAATSEHLAIATYSNAESIYVWIRSAQTRPYERRRPKRKIRRESFAGKRKNC